MRKLISSFLVLSLLPAVSLAGSAKEKMPGKDKMEGYSMPAGTRQLNAGRDANPSGTDGCGLGWQITQKKTMFGTSIRATTNAFVPPTFGMTSGTLGCDKHDIAKNDMEAAKYAYNNQEPLSIEMAQGEGEYLAGFAKTLGCDDSVQGDFAKMTQENYENIVAEGQSPLALLKNVKAQIKANPALAGSCRA